MVVTALPSAWAASVRQASTRCAVDMHGAGAALALVAALLGAGQAEMIAQGVEQRDTRLDLQFMAMSVD